MSFGKKQTVSGSQKRKRDEKKRQCKGDEKNISTKHHRRRKRASSGPCPVAKWVLGQSPGASRGGKYQGGKTVGQDWKNFQRVGTGSGREVKSGEKKGVGAGTPRKRRLRSKPRARWGVRFRGARKTEAREN